jgi:hypothetical protein
MSIKVESVVVEGTFKNDKIVTGSLTDNFGNIFTTIEDEGGQFVEGKLTGKISIAYKNGDKFHGKFKNGKKCGFGT